VTLVVVCSRSQLGSFKERSEMRRNRILFSPLPVEPVTQSRELDPDFLWFFPP
jgi:hypothetical protein